MQHASKTYRSQSSYHASTLNGPISEGYYIAADDNTYFKPRGDQMAAILDFISLTEPCLMKTVETVGRFSFKKIGNVEGRGNHPVSTRFVFGIRTSDKRYREFLHVEKGIAVSE